MDVPKAVLLGVIQGLTEFLPVSSSAHIILSQHILHSVPQGSLTFDVYAHFGSLLSVILVFRRDILAITKSLVQSIVHANIREAYRTDENARMGWALVVATIPAAAAGYWYHDLVKGVFMDPKFVAMNLVVSGLLLFLTKLARPDEQKRVGMGSSILVGIAQAVSIFPGISRSGATISTALYAKLNPELAARFSFLLAIPVILGAVGLETRDVIQHGIDIGAWPIVAGVSAAAVTGYIAIRLLFDVLRHGWLSWFAVYCLAVGICAVIFL